MFRIASRGKEWKLCVSRYNDKVARVWWCCESGQPITTLVGGAGESGVPGWGGASCSSHLRLLGRAHKSRGLEYTVAAVRASSP